MSALDKMIEELRGAFCISDGEARDMIRCVTQAYGAQGYCVVPREPTPEMAEVGDTGEHPMSDVGASWQKMIAAAPKVAA